MADSVKLDLGTSDVHVPSASGKGKGKRKRGGAGLKKPAVVGALKKPVGVAVRAQLGPGGNLHVRHMQLEGNRVVSIVDDADGGGHLLRDFRSIVLGAEVDPASVGVALKGPRAWKDGTPKKLVWVQLAETGAWRGHPAGPFEMTSTTFGEIVRNFDRRGLAVPFDMEHASEADPTSGSIPERGAPAQGWIHKLDNQGDKGLWGLVEWLDYARDGIQAGQFAYLSPAIRFNSRDPISGENVGARLTSAAITNQPFLNGLDGLRAATDGVKDVRRGTTTMADFQIKGGAKALLASLGQDPVGGVHVTQDENGVQVSVELKASQAQGRLAHKSADYMPSVRNALQLHPLASASECSDHLDKLCDMVDASGDAEHANYQGVDLGQFTRPLKYLVDAQPGDTWEEVFDAVRALIQAAMDEHMVEEHGASATDKTNDSAATAAAATAAQPAVASPSAATTGTETNMSDALKDQVTTLEQKITARDTVIASKDGEIKTLTDKVSEQAAQIATLTADIKTMKDAEEERVLTERHDLYKGKASLDAMRAVFRSDRALFDKEYPFVDPSKRHLTQTLTTGKREAHTPIVQGDVKGPSLREAARQLASKTGMPLEQAQRVVMMKAQQARQSA